MKPVPKNVRNENNADNTLSSLEALRMTQNNPKNKFSFSEFINQGKLAWKLFRDPNVSPWVRFGLPITALVYLLFPFDILPDVMPVLGQVDDVAVIMLLAQLLITLAPDNIVAMYRQAEQATGDSPDANPSSSQKASPPYTEDEVIDTDYRVVS